MKKAFSIAERPHGPAILISEQETLVFAGGARLRAPEGVAVSWCAEQHLLCSSASARPSTQITLVLLWIPSGSRNVAFFPPAHLVVGCIPNSA